jgi:hypothetical protein
MAYKIAGFNAHGFFPLGYTKAQVCRTRVTCLQDFKERIVHSAEGITPRKCGSVLRAFENWMDIVRATKGAQVDVQ